MATMKTIYLFSAILIATTHSIYAKEITLNIPDNEIKIVENDVIDAEQWIKDAWRGKVDNCRKRLIKSEVDRSLAAKEEIPAGDDAIINKIFSNPDYKNRKQRDAEALKKLH